LFTTTSAPVSPHFFVCRAGASRARRSTAWRRCSRDPNGPSSSIGPARAIPAIHLYTQLRTKKYGEGQEAFARENSWFRPRLMNAVSHFPTVDGAEEVAKLILDFVS
jgi:hypothetical protein